MNSASIAPPPLDLRLMQAGTRLLFGLFLLGVLGAVLLALSRSPLFALRQIRIEGEVMHNNATTIRANAVPKLAGSYLTLDLQRAKSAFESVPWVRRAVVSRIWPHTLVVRLEEHRAAAYWERDDSEDQLVSREGEVFEVNLGDVEDDDLPTLRGPQGTAAQVWGLYRLLTPLFEPRQERIERLVLSERGSWRMKLDSGSVIELGRGTPEELQVRTQRFVATLPEVTARFGASAANGARAVVEYADLRHSGGYALRLAGMGTTDAKSGKKR